MRACGGTRWVCGPADPRHGAETSDAFHVSVPWLPGYGFSDAPVVDFTPDRIPDLWTAARAGRRRGPAARVYA